MREVGKDPLTWSFVKLFGVHVRHELIEFEDLPASHVWRWQSAGLWKARLLTKAQCIGVVVSIIERADRVELLVDDGTALVKTVVWGESACAPVVLGDLVHVEGKLNVHTNWDAAELSRELRVLRITKVEDPNEEVLHWVQVMELVPTYLSAASGPCVSRAEASDEENGEVHWERITTQAFFNLSINPSSKQRFLSRSGCGRHDETLVETLESFLLMQNTSGKKEAIRVTFSDYMTSAGFVVMSGRHGKVADKSQRIRALQYTFRELRQAGLLFLEDDATDRHVLLSFEAVLKPALLQLLQNHSQGRSIAEITKEVLTQERFKYMPLQWIEQSLEHLLRLQLVTQREESQLFVIK